MFFYKMIMVAKTVCIKDKDMPCKKARQLYRTFLLKYLSIILLVYIATASMIFRNFEVSFPKVTLMNWLSSVDFPDNGACVVTSV